MRKRISFKGSKKLYKRTAAKTRPINLSSGMQRGGTCL